MRNQKLRKIEASVLRLRRIYKRNMNHLGEKSHVKMKTRNPYKQKKTKQEKNKQKMA